MEHAAHDAPAFLHALEQSAFGAFVRDHVLLYPAANILHVLGLAIFFAAVAAMDLRLLGSFREVPAGRFIRRLRPVALVAFLVQAASGIVLFAPEAAALGANPAFQLKAIALALALVNVVVLEVAAGRTLARLPADGPVPGAAKLSAALSLVLWLAVAAFGRAAAYI